MISDYEKNNNNRITLIGYAVGGLEFSHENHGDTFHSLKLRVPRMSGNEDFIPVMIPDKAFSFQGDDIDGAMLRVIGQIRTYNKDTDDGRRRLIIYVFATDIAQVAENDAEPENYAVLNGFVCKPPVYRKTPLQREITDVFLAVNRAYGCSDYIPLVCWGRNAKYAANLVVSDAMTVKGRLQSRPYKKVFPNGTVEERTALELSVIQIDVTKEEDHEEQQVDHLP